MSEAEVQLMVIEALNKYDKEVGNPRHQQNLANFEKVFEVINNLKGTLRAFIFIMGIPAVIASIVVIVRYVQGH